MHGRLLSSAVLEASRICGAGIVFLPCFGDGRGRDSDRSNGALLCRAFARARYLWRKRRADMTIAGRIRAALGRSRFAQNVAFLSTAAFLGQAILLICTPALTRFFDSTAFGIAAVFSSVTSILYPLTSLRYELAIPLPREETVGANLFGLSIVLLLPITLLVALATWLVGPPLLAVTGTESIRPYLWLIPLGFLVPGATQAVTLWLTRLREFRALGEARVARSFGLVAVPLVGGITRTSSPMWLILGQLAGQSAGLFAVVKEAWRKDHLRLSAITRKGMWDAAMQFRRFPQLSLGSGLIEAMTLYAPSLLLAASYGVGVAGSFALATRVVGLPMGLMGQSVSSVYLGEAPRAAEESNLARLYRRTAGRLLLFGGVPVLVVGLIAPWVSTWLFGVGWAQAGRFIRLLALFSAAALVVSPVSQTLAVLRRLDLEFYWTSTRLVLVVASIVLPYRSGLSAEQAVGAYSLVMVSAYVALFLLTSAAIKTSDSRRVSGGDLGAPDQEERA
jgi:O-antigen/teichoic acid export membrane protein